MVSVVAAVVGCSWYVVMPVGKSTIYNVAKEDTPLACATLPFLRIVWRTLSRLVLNIISREYNWSTKCTSEKLSLSAQGVVVVGADVFVVAASSPQLVGG